MSEPCERLDDWLAGQLAVVDQEAFEQHLVGCSRCRSAGGDRVALEMVASGVGAKHRVRWWQRTTMLGAVGVAALMVLVLVLLTRARPERWEVAAPVQIAGVRFTVGDIGPGASGGRPDQVSAPAVRRGASSHGKPLPFAALAEVSRQGGVRALAAALAIANRYDEAERTLAAADDSPAVRSDRAATAILRGNPDEALALADTIPADAQHPQVLWNRAVALRHLGLPLLAGATFERTGEVVAAWRDEAMREAERTRQAAQHRRAGYRDAWAAGDALIHGGGLPDERLVPRHPGILRLYYYDALRVAPSSERARALRPLGEQLDRVYGGSTLARLADRVAGEDFHVRGPLAKDFQALLPGPLGLEGEALDAWLARFERAGQDDILLGALVKTGRTDERGQFRELVERSGDPWFRFLGDDDEAGRLIEQGRDQEARRLLERAIPRCRETGIFDKCGALEMRLIRLLDDEGSSVQARLLARHGLDDARASGALGLEHRFLGYLALLEAERGAFVAGRAYLDEAELSLLDERARSSFARPQNDVARYLAQQRALLSIEEMRPDKAREQLRRSEAAGQLRVDALQAIAELVRWDLSADEIARARSRVAALRAEAGGRADMRQQLDMVEGRLLSGAEPAVARDLLEHALSTRVEGHRATVANTRALAYATLVDLAGTQQRWDEALRLIAGELGVDQPATCAAGISLDLDRLVVVVRDERGGLRGRRERRDPQALRPERILAPDLLSSLARCRAIAVYARAPLQGLAGLLPVDRAWSYRVGPGARRPAGSTGPRRRVVVSGALPPAWLALPSLAPLPPRVEPDEELVSLEGSRAVPSAVLGSIVSADEIEFHVHGLFDVEVSDASLALTPDSDGSFVLGADALERVRLQRAPRVILGSCRAAGAAPTRRQPRSLPIALLRAGASAVFASPAPLSDHAAGQFFDDLRASLSRGVPPAEALRDARVRASQQGLDPSVLDVLLFD